MVVTQFPSDTRLPPMEFSGFQGQQFPHSDSAVRMMTQSMLMLFFNQTLSEKTMLGSICWEMDKEWPLYSMETPHLRRHHWKLSGNLDLPMDPSLKSMQLSMEIPWNSRDAITSLSILKPLKMDCSEFLVPFLPPEEPVKLTMIETTSKHWGASTDMSEMLPFCNCLTVTLLWPRSTPIVQLD